MAQNDWSGRLAQTIAVEVRRHRKRRGLSAQGLADECAELGYPIARQVLANLENGRREAVTVAELLVLGRALRVPPLLLAFPVGQTETTEPIPGEHRDTWDAVRWASGEIPFPNAESPLDISTYDESELEAWADGALGPHVYRQEEQLVVEWTTHVERAAFQNRNAHDDETPERLREVLRASSESEMERAEQARKEIEKLRNSIQKKGLVTRPLPQALTPTNEKENNS